MRAIYRIYGKEGHRQRASWQKSIKIALDNGMTIETWCFDRTGTHEYVDIEVTADFASPADLYEEMQTQLDDGVFECCNYGKIEKLKYSYFWSTGCPVNKIFHEAVANYEKMLNCYCCDDGFIPYDGECFYIPIFHENRFTVMKEAIK